MTPADARLAMQLASQLIRLLQYSILAAEAADAGANFEASSSPVHASL